ncbi:Pet127-domain-containing protein [Microstroma glucosiphilum]|uniref:Pet127-domain-containing protein n=1 Tax=Pseudomicrostroma glucosiphilum TaxID=1684307 RepID=A0A316U363_9BASI|nr:Pet127-domain-containing protein [Pseudomicrostroma glucosiphilum]PWN19749.1 Pet127-domain-containing protein [Pseudomicrostroma glucosiphilum]
MSQSVLIAPPIIRRRSFSSSAGLGSKRLRRVAKNAKKRALAGSSQAPASQSEAPSQDASSKKRAVQSASPSSVFSRGKGKAPTSPSASTTTAADGGFAEVVPGWGPDMLQVMAEDQVASPGPTASSSSAKSSGNRDPPPHMAPAVTTTLLDRDASAKARKIQSGSYVSDKVWDLNDESTKSEGALQVLTGGKLATKDIPFDPVAPLRKMEVATLSHGLDRVLFNPGVHRLKDPRSGVYNFPKTLSDIPDVDLFDYQALPAYVTSSVDEELREIAQREHAQFCGSTSSLTSMLSQVYFLISGWKAPSTKDYSEDFAEEPKGFSMAAKLPALIGLKPRASTDPTSPHRTYYAIDQDKGKVDPSSNSNYVLQNLGKAMEKMLTATPEEFASYLRVNRPSGPPTPDSVKEAYHYAKAGSNFLMRSQLDCHDARLPRATFDLKTRAVVSVRHDRANWVEASGYQINAMKGLFQSYERERYDMARSAWLKYFFQAKIGCMDGILVAYHNSAQVFGFEYFPLEDMAERIFGSMEMADQAFKLSVALSERILQRAIELYPDRQLSLTLETKEPPRTRRSSSSQEVDPNADLMRVWVEPSDARQEGEESAEDDGSIKERKITQFDVTVDRYMWDRIIQGPVDFDAFKMKPSTTKGNQAEEVSLRPFDLQVEYTIRPRGDLSENATYANHDTAVKRLKSMAALILPNLEATNARERRLEAELSKNPEALQRYKEDKKSGIAPGMPRAPGQIDLFRLDDEGSVETPDSDSGLDDGSEEDAMISEAEAAITKGQGQWRAAGENIWSLRKLAQKGARDREAERAQP